jgi:hypothetical protein
LAAKLAVLQLIVKPFIKRTGSHPQWRALGLVLLMLRWAGGFPGSFSAPKLGPRNFIVCAGTMAYSAEARALPADRQNTQRQEIMRH